MFSVLHQGEVVLPAHAAEAFRSFGPSMASLVGLLEGLVDRLSPAQGSGTPTVVKVYGAEHAYLQDGVDVEMQARATARHVQRALQVQGG